MMKSLLVEKGIEFDWKEGRKFASIKYNSNYDEEGLNSCIEAVVSFVDTFVKYEFLIQRHIWDDVVEAMSKDDLFPRDDPPKIQFLKDQLKMKVIFRDSESNQRKRIEEKLLAISKEALFDEKKLSYSKEYISLLKKINFVENNIKGKYKDV